VGDVQPQASAAFGSSRVWRKARNESIGGAFVTPPRWFCALYVIYRTLAHAHTHTHTHTHTCDIIQQLRDALLEVISSSPHVSVQFERGVFGARQASDGIAADLIDRDGESLGEFDVVIDAMGVRPPTPRSSAHTHARAFFPLGRPSGISAIAKRKDSKQLATLGHALAGSMPMFRTCAPLCVDHHVQVHSTLRHHRVIDLGGGKSKNGLVLIHGVINSPEDSWTPNILAKMGLHGTM
jgi:hypothetical protein